MATYTITINERTKFGKSVIEFLRNIGAIVEKKEECSLDKSIAEYKAGKTYKAKDGHDLIEQCLK